VKRLFAAVHPRSETAPGGTVHPQLITVKGAAVRPRPMTEEECMAIRQRRRRLRHRLRLRLLGVGRAGWIAVGLLVVLWTVGTLL
jgi:hypothetical protein